MSLSVGDITAGASLVFTALNRTEKAKISTDLFTVRLDASVRRGLRFENDITASPVESGEEIADHIIRKPMTLTLEGIVSDVDSSIIGAQIAAVTNLTAGVSQALGIGEGITKPSIEALRQLLEIRGHAPEGADSSVRPKEVTIITRLGVWPGMWLRSLDVPEDAETGEALRFTAEFQQIKTVESQTTTIATPATVDMVGSTTNHGRRGPTAGVPAPDSTDTSSANANTTSGGNSTFQNLTGFVR